MDVLIIHLAHTLITSQLSKLAKKVREYPIWWAIILSSQIESGGFTWHASAISVPWFTVARVDSKWIRRNSSSQEKLADIREPKFKLELSFDPTELSAHVNRSRTWPGHDLSS